MLQKLKSDAKQKVRITEWLQFTLPVSRLEEMRRAGGTTDPWLKTGALKALVDGSLGSRTAALLAPYSDDPSTPGILRLDPAALMKMAVERDRVGFQIALHAIGDRGNKIAIRRICRRRKGKRPARPARPSGARASGGAG